MILNYTPDFIGENGILPRLVRLLCNDDIDTITQAGYLSSTALQSNPLYLSDFVFISYGTDMSTHGIFFPTYNAGVMTLNLYTGDGNVSYTGTLISGNVPQFDGTSGEIKDSGILVTNLQTISSIKANKTAVWGGGSTSNAFALAGATASAIVIASIYAQAGTASILKVVPGTNILTVTFSADPGAGTQLSYVMFYSAQ